MMRTRTTPELNELGPYTDYLTLATHAAPSSLLVLSGPETDVSQRYAAFGAVYVVVRGKSSCLMRI